MDIEVLDNDDKNDPDYTPDEFLNSPDIQSPAPSDISFGEEFSSQDENDILEEDENAEIIKILHDCSEEVHQSDEYFYMCQFCPLVFKLSMLEEHINNQHFGRTLKETYLSSYAFTSSYFPKSRKENINCNLCSKNFTPDDINRHITLSHKEYCIKRKLPICVKCVPSNASQLASGGVLWFYRKSDLDSHQCKNLRTVYKYNQTCVERYKCDECPNNTNEMEPGILDEHFLLSHQKRLTTLPLKPLIGKIYASKN